MSSDEMVQVFCRNVCFLRVKHRLSQSAFATLLGITAYSLRRIEKGGTLPRTVGVDFLCRLSALFRVSTDTLLHVDMAEAHTHSAD